MNLSEQIQQVKRDTMNLNVVFKDDDCEVVDITGSTVYLTVKNKSTDEDVDAIFQIIQTSHVDPTNGRTILTVPSADTANVDPKVYFFDIQIVFSNNEIQTPSGGTWEIIQDITFAT